VSFQLADLLYRHIQMSATNINDLLELWAATLPSDADPPFASKQDLYETVDSIEAGDVAWECFSVCFNGEIAEGDTTPWKRAEYEVWFRDPRKVLHNQLRNRSFVSEMDFSAKEVRDNKGKHRYTDFMSGDWAWRQSVHAFSFKLYLKLNGMCCRTKFPRIKKPMELPFVQLFLEVIKPQSQLQLVKMSTIPYTCQMVLSTIMFAELIAMLSR
jgi:hypothetical protein